MLGLAAVLILHCRPTGSNPFHPCRPLAAILPLFLRRVQLPIPLGLNLLLMPDEHVLRRHVTDRAVQPEIVVSVHILLNQAFCIFQRQRRPRSNAFAFQRLVPTFQLAIRLRVVRRGSYVRHARDAPLQRLLPKERSSLKLRFIYPYDSGVFMYARNEDSILVVSNIQAYLDLYAHGGRDLKQADHLLANAIEPSWTAA
jgi:hypothetical protein